ncbi:hypothetical protein GCM10028815_30840 [Mariniluteicoccus flavus]
MLNFGRRRRLISRAQRRALMVRANGMCEYPGCTSTHRLDGHHVVPWLLAGLTDLDNLALLCRRHHVVIHEGGVTITRDIGDDRGVPSQWRFTRPNGERVRAPGDPGYWDLDTDTQILQLVWAARRHAEQSVGDISPVGGGAGFLLHECIQAMCAMAVAAEAG